MDADPYDGVPGRQKGWRGASLCFWIMV